MHTHTHTQTHTHTHTHTAQHCTYGAARKGERQQNTEGGWQRGEEREVDGEKGADGGEKTKRHVFRRSKGEVSK